MKRPCIPLAVIFFIAVTLPAFGKSPEHKDVETYVNKFLNEEDKYLMEDRATTKSKKIIVSDIDYNGEDDIVLYYVILGPTWYEDKVVLFLQKHGKFEQPINADVHNSIRSIRVDKDMIIVEGKELGPNDPLCCPTAPYKNVFKLKGTKLIEKQ